MDYFKLKKMERMALIKRIKVYEKRIYLLKLRKFIIIIFLFFGYIRTFNNKNKNKRNKIFSSTNKRFERLKLRSPNITKNKVKKNIHKYNYENDKFAILTSECSNCGLFSFYIYYLGCVNKYILKGYIPVIDMKSYPIPYNNFTINKNKTNPWEYLFEQPFGYTLEEVLQNAKNKEYFNCHDESINRPSETTIFYNKELINFWHNVSKKYLPIKKEIINESNNIRKYLFKNSRNILGVKMRGTDYVTVKPKYHPVIPPIEMVISDIKNMTSKNHYDWIFFASEDERMKARIISEFKDKVKYLNANKTINYDYKGNQFFTLNKDVVGDLEYAKNYLMNIYILSKCTDIIMTRGSGGAGIIILTEGFRNSLIYNLGDNHLI